MIWVTFLDTIPLVFEARKLSCVFLSQACANVRHHHPCVWCTFFYVLKSTRHLTTFLSVCHHSNKALLEVMEISPIQSQSSSYILLLLSGTHPNMSTQGLPFPTTTPPSIFTCLPIFVYPVNISLGIHFALLNIDILPDNLFSFHYTWVHLCILVQPNKPWFYLKMSSYQDPWSVPTILAEAIFEWALLICDSPPRGAVYMALP